MGELNAHSAGPCARSSLDGTSRYASFRMRSARVARNEFRAAVDMQLLKTV